MHRCPFVTTFAAKAVSHESHLPYIRVWTQNVLDAFTYLQQSDYDDAVGCWLLEQAGHMKDARVVSWMTGNEAGMEGFTS